MPAETLLSIHVHEKNSTNAKALTALSHTEATVQSGTVRARAPPHESTVFCSSCSKARVHMTGREGRKHQILKNTGDKEKTRPDRHVTESTAPPWPSLLCSYTPTYPSNLEQRFSPTQPKAAGVPTSSHLYSVLTDTNTGTYEHDPTATPLFCFVSVDNFRSQFSALTEPTQEDTGKRASAAQQLEERMREGRRRPGAGGKSEPHSQTERRKTSSNLTRYHQPSSWFSPSASTALSPSRRPPNTHHSVATTILSCLPACLSCPSATLTPVNERQGKRRETYEVSHTGTSSSAVPRCCVAYRLLAHSGDL